MLYCCSTQKQLRLATSEEDANDVELKLLEPISEEDIDNLDFQYVLPEDPYANAVLELMTLGGRNNFMSAVFAIMFMLGIAAMQVGLAYAVLAEIRNVETESAWMVEDVVCDSQLEGVPRIWPGKAEKICGAYLPLKAGLDKVFYEPPNSHWDPRQWQKNDLSLLAETMSQMTVMYPTYCEFWVLFTALVAWGAAILAELVDAMHFARVLCSLPAGYSLQNSNGFQLVGLHPCQKALACVIGAYRMILGVFLCHVGVRFLNSNVAVVDIILNSVALAFVLEVDTVIYKAYAHFRGGLASQQVVAMLPAQRRYFPRACKGMTTLAAICIFALVTMCLQWQMLVARFNTFSSICLFFGPTPKMDYRFDVAFPVPGLCESLVCGEVEAKTGRCLALEPDAIKDYEKFESVKHLYGVCSIMLQANISSTYKVQADGQNSGQGLLRNESLSDRQTDADLASLGLGDLASNFWCPVSSISRLFKIPDANSSMDGYFDWFKSYADYLCQSAYPLLLDSRRPDLSAWKFDESEFETANVSCQSPIRAVKDASNDSG